jgi:hypothetical protein
MEAVVVDAQLHRGQVEQRGLDPVVGAAAGQVGQDTHFCHIRAMISSLMLASNPAPESWS